MLAKNMFLVFALSAIGLAQDVDDNDVPQQCRSVCASVVTLSNTCDRQNNDNDAGYLNCVCTSQDASSQIPLCEACVAANDNDGRDNDVNDLLRSCSFTTTSYNPSATSATQTASGSQSLTSNTSLPTGSGVSSALSSGLSSLTTPATSNTASSGATTQTTGSIADQSTNIAPMPTAGMIGVGLGALGIAWGML